MSTARFVLPLALAACGGAHDADPPYATGAPPPRRVPAHTVGSFAIDVPASTLQPGDEIFPCFIFPLEVTGPSHIVGGAKLTVGHGMHHGNVTTRRKTGEGARACPADDGNGAVGGEALDVLAGGAVLFGSSTQISGEEWQSFPDGVGYRIADGYEIVARMHYLNPSSAPVTVAPRYEWYTIDESSVVREVSPFAWVYKEFIIPPEKELTVTSAPCAFENPMHLVTVLPHMHRLGRRFQAAFAGGALDGKAFLDSPGYDPENGVMTEFDPAIDLSQGVGATFSCTWKNTFDKPIQWGVGDNEMCMMYGYAWPRSAAYSVFASDTSCFTVLPP